MFHLFSHVKIRIFRVFARSLPSKKILQKNSARRRGFGARFPNIKTSWEDATYSSLFPTPDTGSCAPKSTTRARMATINWKMRRVRVWRADHGLFLPAVFLLHRQADLHKNHGIFAGPHPHRSIATICAIVCSSAWGWHRTHRSRRRLVLVAVIGSQRMPTMPQCSTCCARG